jgi:hypothetical protein
MSTSELVTRCQVPSGSVDFDLGDTGVGIGGPPSDYAGRALYDGGFVLLADPTRNRSAVAAYDANGKELGRQSLHGVPTRCLPGAVRVHPPADCPSPNG